MSIRKLDTIIVGPSPPHSALMNRWRVRFLSALTDTVEEDYFFFKYTALAAAKARVDDLVKNGRGVSVRVAGKDGRYQEERTYPRARDPQKSPG